MNVDIRKDYPFAVLVSGMDPLLQRLCNLGGPDIIHFETVHVASHQDAFGSKAVDVYSSTEDAFRAIDQWTSRNAQFKQLIYSVVRLTSAVDIEEITETRVVNTKFIVKKLP
jgi:hypothetical protein